MFIGHFAVAFGLKRAAPEVKLGTATIAGVLLDTATLTHHHPTSRRSWIGDILDTTLSLALAYWVDRHRVATSK